MNRSGFFDTREDLLTAGSVVSTGTVSLATVGREGALGVPGVRVPAVEVPGGTAGALTEA